MSGTLEHKWYKLDVGGETHNAAVAYMAERVKSMQDPAITNITDKLGRDFGVTATHPIYGYGIIFPTLYLSPHGDLKFLMKCPVGETNDSPSAHFIPEDSEEIFLGIESLILGRSVVFEREPIVLRPPIAAPKPNGMD